MSELSLLKNIGKEMERKLKSIGVNSAEELKKNRKQRYLV